MTKVKRNNFHEFYGERDRLNFFECFDEFYESLSETIKMKEYAYRRTLKGFTSSNVETVCSTSGDNKRMIMMGSNNYLDLANDQRVKDAAIAAIGKYGYGSGSVSLLAGTFEIHRTLEERIASFYSRDAAAVFPTGYSANVGVVSSVVKSKDLLLLDMYSHASLVDGTKMTDATVKFFKHNDMEHLEKLLKKLRHKYNAVLIITDGVFSMDGDVCALDKLIELKKKYNASLLMDEAHAIGIIGDEGRGTEEYFNLVGEVDFITGTLSKAPAGLGGYVTGKRSMVEYVRHFSNSYVFSTSSAPPVVGGLIEVFNILENDHSKKDLLQKNIDFFHNELREAGFNIGETITAITPVIIGDETKTKLISKELAEKGIFASAVIFPAVSKTQSRIRLSLMATHTKEELATVLDALVLLGKKYGVI